MSHTRPPDDLLPEPGADLSDDDLDALYRLQPVARPPAGFAERIVPRARRRRARWLAAAATLAAAAAGLVLWMGPGEPRSGALDARTRTTARLADRATVVAEAGARITWAVAEGAIEVRQPRGRAFYRVDEGPLTVRTPAGDVRVLGTCFSLEVDEMSPALKSGALGALIGVAATVAVYEGTVRLGNGYGDVQLGPGQRGQATLNEPPIRIEDDDPWQVERVTPPPPPAPPPAPIPPPPSGQAGEPRVAELQALLEETRAELRRVERVLEAEQAMRIEVEGEPVPFPEDLPDRFGEQALREHMREAIEQAGVQGEVVSIDCAEFPCVVYAEFEGGDSEVNEKLFATDAMAPYADDGKNIAAWGRRTKEDDGEPRESTFVGLALLPRNQVEEQHQSAVNKRLQFRNRQAFEAFAPPPGDAPPE